MCLPRNILNRVVDEFIQKNKLRLKNHIYFFAALKDLKEKPTYEETYGPEKYRKGLSEGKKTVERLDRVRSTDITKLLAKDKEILAWWTSI